MTFPPPSGKSFIGLTLGIWNTQVYILLFGQDCHTIMLQKNHAHPILLFIPQRNQSQEEEEAEEADDKTTKNKRTRPILKQRL
ncbi:hypothetical protein BC833DRAFT_625256 [Globomyces pollinis-pini]|nr:hypothetical protein BC833DRAFT_625256 [Globomyces pollinis-pini]